MRYVVDASVAVKWLVVEEGAEIAKELAVDGHDLHAPRLMASEVASSLWRKARMGELERNSVGALLAQVPNMPVRWGADETLREGLNKARFSAWSGSSPA
ncbi:MAG: type II toxin-antitoxin system VapC family toxin, partial [Gammaproteobacteria bacterium]|nr:type II toxin-antitoxin system VapC family toxin [Gammaproteobacteria bacterium]MYE29031.1 type II toxin-antitoxin system VapC family toxin [Gammaproteobacteria bacterium]